MTKPTPETVALQLKTFFGIAPKALCKVMQHAIEHLMEYQERSFDRGYQTVDMALREADELITKANAVERARKAYLYECSKWSSLDAEMRQVGWMMVANQTHLLGSDAQAKFDSLKERLVISAGRRNALANDLIRATGGTPLPEPEKSESNAE